MRKQLFHFGRLLVASGTLLAQSNGIRGIVTDPSGAAIRGAGVRCNGQTVTTGLDGRFEFPAASRCTAEVSAPGFEKQTVDLTAGSNTRIRLAVAGLSEKIVVTASRYPAALEESGVAAEVFTQVELARRQYPSLGDLLREVPGLQVVASGTPGSLTSVFTRGAQRTGTLVLVDGVPVNDPGGEFNLAHLTSGDLGRVEVVRGPESALFGAEAAAGVIQLFTQRGDPENLRPRGAVSYERGSFGAGRWLASLSGGSGYRLDYAVHASQNRTAGEFPNNAYRNTTGSANLGLRLSASTEIRGVARIGDAAMGVPGQVAYGLIDRDARETNRDAVVSLRLNDSRGPDYVQQVSFAYHRVRDVYTDLLMDGPYQLSALVRDVPGFQPRTYLVSLLPPGTIPPAAPPGTRAISQEVWLYPFGEPYVSATSRTRAGYQGNWSRRGFVSSFGYDYERQEGDVSSRRVDRNNHGVFLHLQKTLAGRLFLSGGIRMEHSSAYGRKLAPRAAVGYRIAGEHGVLSSTYVRLSAGRGITEPSLIQTFAREFYATGNPDLRPERTASYETGIVQEWFGRRARTEVSLFHNSFRDLITFVSLPPPVWGSWRNLDSSRARGVEFSARARLAGPVTVNAAYMRLWSRVLYSSSAPGPFYGAGQELPRRPGNSGSLSLSIAPRRWWVQAGAFLVGERQDADYYLGVNRNPGYQNVYLTGSFRLSPNVMPFLRADNLLNSRYQEALGYSSQGRSLRGGVRLEW